MDFVTGKHANSELLRAQAQVWNCCFNFISSMSLKCAVQLGIPDVIHRHGQPTTLSGLVTALPIHPSKTSYVHRLMDLLVHAGFFAHQKLNQNDQEQGYVLTHASRLLLRDNPFCASPFFLVILHPVMTKPWDSLCAWFQNDEPTAFRTLHKMDFWEYTGRDRKFGQLFDHGMASDARLVQSIVVDKGKGLFEGLGSLVDVGGGDGTMAKAIADAFPHVDCTVFDLPHVVEGLHGTKNLKYVGGDMFEVIPPAEAVLLKWILHDWSDEDCGKILGKCREAITSEGKTGKVIVIDMVVGSQAADKELVETQLFFDMEMMALLNGKERNEKEWAELFFSSGFKSYKIVPILGLRSLIEVYP